MTDHSEVLRGGDLWRRRLYEARCTLVAHALKRTGGNISQAARYLGVERNTLLTVLRPLRAPR